MTAHDDSSRIRQLFFTNLQLLGFDPAAMAAINSIPFNREMFDLPNRKGCEVVMHFLFSKLDITMCREQFRDCWPVRDKKTAQVFIQTVHRWLDNIAKEEVEANFPHIVPSIFLNPGGDKFIRLLFYFSMFVLKQCIRKDNGVKNHEMLKEPRLTPDTVSVSGCIGKVVECNSVRQRKQFLEKAPETVLAQQLWREYTSELVKAYRFVSKSIRQLEHELRDAKQKSADTGVARGSPIPSRRKSHTHEFDLKGQAIKRAQRVQKVREMWRALEGFESDQSAEIDLLKSIFLSSVDEYRIDGQDIDIKVPELLLRECEQEIQRRQVDNTYESGKINLLSLVQLWNLSLHLYIEKLQEVGVPRVELYAVKTQVHTGHSHVSNAQSFRNKLSKDVLPDLQASIEELQSTVGDSLIKYISPANQRSVSKFELLVPTPPISFTPEDPEQTTPEQFSTRVTPQQDTCTPDAVGAITDSITRLSKKLFQRSSKPLSSSGKSLLHSTSRVSHQSKLPTRVSPKPVRKEALSPSHLHSTPTRSDEPNRGVLFGGTSLNSKEQDNCGEIFSPSRTTQLSQQQESKQTPSKQELIDTHGLSRTPANTATPRAHKILAEKIALSVLEGSPFPDANRKGSDQIRTHRSDFNLENPSAAFDTEAFLPRDKLIRSPVGSGWGSPGKGSPGLGYSGKGSPGLGSPGQSSSGQDSPRQGFPRGLSSSPPPTSLEFIARKGCVDSGGVDMNDGIDSPQPNASHLLQTLLKPSAVNSHSALNSFSVQNNYGSTDVNDSMAKGNKFSLLSPCRTSQESNLDHVVGSTHSTSSHFRQTKNTESSTTTHQFTSQTSDRSSSHRYRSPSSPRIHTLDHGSSESPSYQTRNSDCTKRSRKLSSQKLLDSSYIVTQLQLDSEEMDVLGADELRPSVFDSPTAPITQGLFSTITPTLNKSHLSDNVLYVTSGIRATCQKETLKISPNFKISEDFDMDILSVSPPVVMGIEEDDFLTDIAGADFNQLPLKKSLQADSSDESIQESKIYIADFSPEYLKTSLEIMQKGRDINVREVFSEDSLNVEQTRSVPSEESMPTFSNQCNLYPEKNQSFSQKTTHLAKGDTLENSYAPLEHGLQFFSPFRNKMVQKSQSPTTETAPNAMEELIAKYKKLREAALKKSPTSVSRTRTPVRHLSMTSTQLDTRHSNPVHHRDLFTLDLDDIGLEDGVDCKKYPVTCEDASPGIDNANNSILDSFLGEENIFLVPTSPGQFPTNDNAENDSQ